MDWDTILSILKWIALAFAAGIIGYFGKHLGKIIIARFSKKEKDKSPQEDRISTTNSKKAELDSKLEKKRIKAEQKKLKKSKKK